jgi:hypothetical protein
MDVGKFIVLAMLSMAAGSVAFADGDHGHHEHQWPPTWWHDPVSAPEIDPASAISGLSLLIGGLAVVRGRRGK